MADEAAPHLTRGDRLLAAAGGWLAALLARLLGSTWRLAAIDGDRRFADLLAGGGPVVFACWHNRLAICGRVVERRLVRHGLPIVALVSQSRDGELLARTARRLGYRVVRGSPTRGGLQGLRRLYRAVKHDGYSVGTAPDGSQGPVYVAKAGVVILAQIAGVPVLPMGAAVDRAWRLGSWDRLIVPKPFARVALAVGEPIRVPPELDRGGLDEATRGLERTLNELVERAEEALAAEKKGPASGRSA